VMILDVDVFTWGFPLIEFDSNPEGFTFTPGYLSTSANSFHRSLHQSSTTAGENINSLFSHEVSDVLCQDVVFVVRLNSRASKNTDAKIVVCILL